MSKQAFMLADRASGGYLSITIWESEEAQKRNATSSGQTAGRQAMTDKYFGSPLKPPTFEVVGIVE